MSIFIILIICLVIFLVIRTKSSRVHIKNDRGFIQRGVLSKQECKEFIKIAKKYQLETKNDEVDDEPEYQIDIIAESGINWELWEKCKPIYLNRLKPIIASTNWIPEDKRITYLFLRRYVQGQRTHVPMHQDDNYLTMSFLLSNPNDFTGGQLYVFDLDTSKQMDTWGDKFHESNSQREHFINNHPNLPILDYRQGDLAIYTGGENYHGTLPVTDGERYILTFFFS